MKVLCVGDINLDIITPPIKYFPLREEQLIVRDFKWFLGGSTAITAAALSSLGVETTMVGAVGEDMLGNLLIKKLKKWGVKSLIKKTTTPTEVTFAVTFENSSRSFITTAGANKNLKISDVPELEGYDHLHLSSYYHLKGMQSSIRTLFSRAKKKEMTISFDPGFVAGASPVQVKKLLPMTDILFLNEAELQKFGGSQYCSRRVPVLAIHAGAKGGIVYTKGKKYTYSTPSSVRPVNLTGAGDVYNAMFIKCFLEKRPVEECLKKAVKASSFYIKQKEQRFPVR